MCIEILMSLNECTINKIYIHVSSIIKCSTKKTCNKRKKKSNEMIIYLNRELNAYFNIFFNFYKLLQIRNETDGKIKKRNEIIVECTV